MMIAVADMRRSDEGEEEEEEEEEREARRHGWLPRSPHTSRARSSSSTSGGSSPSSRRSSGGGGPRAGPPAVAAAQRQRQRQRGLRYRLVPWTCGTMIALLNLGTHIVAAPLVQLIELSVCHSYYAGQHRPTAAAAADVLDDDGARCKVTAVQARVAYLIGLVSMFSLVSGMWNILSALNFVAVAVAVSGELLEGRRETLSLTPPLPKTLIFWSRSIRSLVFFFLIFFVEIISTLPLGYLSDKHGRKLVLYLNLTVAILGYIWILVVG
jgi:hypothetical protein